MIYDWDPQRIDKAMTTTWASRNYIQHLISYWYITLNNQSIKKSTIVRTGDRIEIIWEPTYDQSPAFELDIVYETQDYAVIVKPRWIVCHPTSRRAIEKPSVAWAAYHRRWSLPHSDPLKAWLVHRLDQETDWLMIIALTQVWYEYFTWLFRDKSAWNTTSLVKKYTAYTLIKKPRIHELPYTHTSMIIPKIPYSIPKIGISIFEKYEIDWNYAQFEISLITWRTHQIRYHCVQLWHPIMWDTVYWIPWKIMHLTSGWLSFIDMNNINVSLVYKSEWMKMIKQ